MPKLRNLAILLSASSLAFADQPPSVDAAKVPECAKGSITSIENNECGWNVACLCQDATAIDTIKQYVRDHCSGDDLPAAYAFGETLCAMAGVEVVPERFYRGTDSTPTFSTHSPQDTNVSWLTLQSVTSNSGTTVPVSVSVSAASMRYGNATSTSTSSCAKSPGSTSTAPAVTFTGAAGALQMAIPGWNTGQFGVGAGLGLLGMVGVALFL